MKCASIALALAAVITGLLAAWYWYKSANIEAPPAQALKSVIEVDGGETPTNKWAREVAEKNKVAALWTAASVVLSALSSISGSLA